MPLSTNNNTGAPPNGSKILQDTYLVARTLRSNEHLRDALGRKPGESLDPTRFDEEALRKKKAQQGPRAWAALWMQDPRIQGGGLVDRKEHFLSHDVNKRRVLSPEAFKQATAGLRWGRGYDIAYTSDQWNKADPDYTAGAKVAFKVDEDAGDYEVYIEDIVYWKEQWGESKKRIREIAREDGADVAIGAEGNGPQSAAFQDIADMPALATYTKVKVPVNKDKSARAQLWASRAQMRKVWLKEGAWNNLFFDQAEGFPNAAHDDLVDAVSVGYVLAAMLAEGFEGEAEEVREEALVRRW